jgi:GNAT superfamily N-acetyltransferase
LDIEAVRFTDCDDGWDQFVEYWKNEPDTMLNENFFVKVILDGARAVGVMALFLEKDTCYNQEIIVSPDRRKQGVGSSALVELLENSEYILRRRIKKRRHVYTHQTMCPCLWM